MAAESRAIFANSPISTAWKGIEEDYESALPA
jgi:hypothetical protein